MSTVRERFDAKWQLDAESGCWLWTASRDPKGYGWFRAGSRSRHAHRISWELRRGSIPNKLHVLHACDNPPCVNPDHLFLGTNAENMADKMRKGRWRGGPPSGEANANAVLTEEAVRAIRVAARCGTSQRALARYFGVRQSTVWNVVHQKTWRHVDDR